MTFRFKLQEPIPAAIRRIALEQIEMAEAKLGDKQTTPASIHDARRGLKRLRALLRLVRPALDEDAYGAHAELLAGTGKLLAQARDSHVMSQTLAKLESRPDALPKAALAPLRKAVVGGPAPRRRTGRSDGRKEAIARLKLAKKLYTGRALSAAKFEHLLEGVARSYDAARKRFRKAYRKPSDEAFHDWRKSVQQHWRHMLLLSRGWPEAFSARAGEAKELSRLLGEDHDYAVLLAFAQTCGPDVISPADLDKLTKLCRACQSELRGQAQPRGARLLAETADELTDRLAHYWASAERLVDLEPPPEKGAQMAPRRQSSPAARQVLSKSLTSIRRKAP